QEQLITDGSFTNVLRTGQLLERTVETLYEAVERSFPGATTIAANQPSGRGADISTLDLVGIPRLALNLAHIGINLLRNRSVVNKEREAAVKDWKTETLKDSL